MEETTTHTSDKPNLSEPTDKNVASDKDELAMAVADAKRPENRISVPARLRSPSDLMREAKELLGDAGRDDIGLIQRCYVHGHSQDRRSQLRHSGNQR